MGDVLAEKQHKPGQRLQPEAQAGGDDGVAKRSNKSIDPQLGHLKKDEQSTNPMSYHNANPKALN